MNAQETRALRDMGRDAWNDWASQILKSKANFQDAGAFSLNWYGEADNDETRLWLKVATADFSNEHFEDEIDFDGFIFPGSVNLSGAVFDRPVSFAGAEFQLPANFGRAHFHADANFEAAKFSGQAVFDDAVFDGVADFERAEFLKEKNGPLTHSVRFQRARFMGKADFRSSVMIGSADFSKAQFAGTARFDETRFTADSVFEGAVFSAPAGFNACQFFGTAAFRETQFTGEARFAEAAFKGECQFERSQFWNDVSFRDAHFDNNAVFTDMRVEGASRFKGAKFAMEANFLDARFTGNADFSGSDFGGATLFRSTQFAQGASWESCRFLNGADFSGLTLGKVSSFEESQFEGDAFFREAQFDASVSLAGAHFKANADFSALQSKAAFVLAKASFAVLPNFLEASLLDPPRFDNMEIADPVKPFHKWKEAPVSDPRHSLQFMRVCADPDASAKYRRLKKLAFEAQDLAGEQEFFAQELRCRRFWLDKPFGRGAARFWFGWAYGGVSDFGRSLIRPFLLWLSSIFVFAIYYLGEGSRAAWTRCAGGSSDPISESLYLSFRNAFLKIDWNDAVNARRVLGCLYGVEFGATPVLPPSVASVSLVQAFVSAGLILLFLLALRNLLRLR